MKKLYWSAVVYLVLGLVGGLYYRELTKAVEFTGPTELGVVHTHLLVLGMTFFLILIGLERLFGLSRSALFPWFLRTYHAGLVLTAGALAVIGTRTVLGLPSGAALAGVSGLGHILLTVGLALLFGCLRTRLFAPASDNADDAARPAALR
ncbi:DUF2871 domain-containing protein [Pseudonocardia asaccharolytica]|uniref:Membrane protein n=1 Tax=Pseudonocardia asaccharolytica DSM 44247 = NBRC 16224 TaxID=1123024 RepID=A0A511D7F4_9PSEU|nr:DUF2871 domain-containing protein [Pseudonocardia asaccharolytica]GEL20730.1 membrane protein [Pseudonocardia asaccharolytica DSM 44247 = NBRC 16224]